MIDIGKASCAIEIEIFCVRSQGLLVSSQKDCIERILGRFNMEKYSARIAPIQEEGQFSLMKCLNMI